MSLKKSESEVQQFLRVIRPLRGLRVEIRYTSNGRLSFCGSGYYGSGQCSEALIKGYPADGYTRKDCFRLKQAWDRWHLNDMRAGTQKQEELVREWKKKFSPEVSYENTCKMLEDTGFLFDNGYKYGSKWLKEEVPNDVLEWLFSLPGEGATFDDIRPIEIGDDEFLKILII